MSKQENSNSRQNSSARVREKANASARTRLPKNSSEASYARSPQGQQMPSRTRNTQGQQRTSSGQQMSSHGKVNPHQNARSHAVNSQNVRVNSAASQGIKRAHNVNQPSNPQRAHSPNSANSPQRAHNPNNFTGSQRAYNANHPNNPQSTHTINRPNNSNYPAKACYPNPANQSAQDSQDKKKKRKGLWRFVFWFALIVFLACLAILGYILFSYWQGQDRYTNLADKYMEVSADESVVTLADLKVDWDALKEENPDVVAWIYIPGTVVNYPVMYSGDDTYLTRDFFGNIGGWWMANYGAVYLAGINNPDFSDTNNIIYGHNLLNGSMFHQLETFTNQEAFDEHRTIYFLTPAGNYRLVTFADVNVRATDPVVQAQFASPEEYTSYVQDKIDKSTVTPAEGMPEASSISQTFAFSTCDHDHSGDKRYVLFSYVAEFVAANSTSGSSSSIVDNSTAEDINSAQGDLL